MSDTLPVEVGRDAQADCEREVMRRNENIIYARPGRVPDDIVKAYREAVIIDGRWEDQWSEE